MFTEEFIAKQLQAAYRPGEMAAGDGYPEMHKNEVLKCAAVLIPLARSSKGWQLVFTRRTEKVAHHKGQVSFPGGGCEVGESTPEMTALREAREEIGINPEEVQLLGRMNPVITITGYRVTPVIGVIPWPYRVRLEKQEVRRLFTIPLLWLADHANWVEQPITPDGAPRPFPIIRYRPYDGEILWGITARITHHLLAILGLLN